MQVTFIPVHSKDTLLSLPHPKPALPPPLALQPIHKSRDFFHSFFLSQVAGQLLS